MLAIIDVPELMQVEIRYLSSSGGSLDGLDQGDDGRMRIVYAVDAVLTSQCKYWSRYSYCEIGRYHPENIASLVCAAHHISVDQSLRVLAHKFVHDTLTSPGIGGFRTPRNWRALDWWYSHGIYVYITLSPRVFTLWHCKVYRWYCCSLEFTELDFLTAKFLVEAEATVLCTIISYERAINLQVDAYRSRVIVINYLQALWIIV